MRKPFSITSFKDVRTLTALAAEFNVDIGIHDNSGNIADAKSLLGLMALDYSHPIYIVVDDNDSYVIDLLIREMAEDSDLEKLFMKLNPSLYLKS